MYIPRCERNSSVTYFMGIWSVRFVFAGIAPRKDFRVSSVRKVNSIEAFKNKM